VIEEALDLPPDENTPAPVILDRATMLAEAHAWGKAFIKRSKEWRQATYEEQWRRWQRAADSIYDPELAKEKKGWQSKVVWPMVPSHRESAQAQLYRTEMGPRPPFDVVARPGVVPPEELAPGADQSGIIKDTILREREKSRYMINRNSVIEDKTTYGDGFAQIYFETDIQDRLVMEPVQEEIKMPWQDGGASLGRSLSGQPQISYVPVVKPSVIYRGIRFRHISIWDVFPDPIALEIKGHPIGIRYNMTYEDIINGAKPQADGTPGHILPEAVEALKSASTEEITPSDKQGVQSDRKIANFTMERTDYARNFECFEIQARLPKKWVLINGEDIDDPEALMPAILRFHDLTLLSIYPSDSYDGEPDIYQDKYMPVAGQFYSRGIPEMLKDCAPVASETVNQRLDAGAVSLKKLFAVIEKCVVDPKDFDEWMNGTVLRLKAKDGMTNIDQLFKQVDMSPPANAAFIESQEWERAAQERTSITQTTLGTEDNTDTTLGAQRIQQGVTGTKIAYLGMLSEASAQYDYFRAYQKLIYQNYQPEDYAMAIGPERAAQVIPLTPEQVENNYQYMPLGIFEMENKAQRQAQVDAWVKTFGMMPWANVLGAAKEELRTMNIDEKKMILPEAEAIQIMAKAEEMAAQKAEQMIAERDAANAGNPGEKKSPENTGGAPK
jgi:hypothetical protein